MKPGKTRNKWLEIGQNACEISPDLLSASLSKPWKNRKSHIPSGFHGMRMCGMCPAMNHAALVGITLWKQTHYQVAAVIVGPWNPVKSVGFSYGWLACRYPFCWFSSCFEVVRDSQLYRRWGHELPHSQSISEQEMTLQWKVAG